MPAVLIADDDPTVSQVLCEYLRRAEISPIAVFSGEAALTAVQDNRPDLAILDVMMGPPDGLEVCRQLRADPLTADMPIILLTAMGEELDRIAGFERGADDYVTKPFSPREIILRVEALLRRSQIARSSPSKVLRSGELLLDPSARLVTKAAMPLPLTTREYDLLSFLIQHAGQVFSREVLMRRVWGWTFGDESTVTVHVRRLREKIEDQPSAPTQLVTVWGSGYRWDGANAP